MNGISFSRTDIPIHSNFGNDLWVVMVQLISSNALLIIPNYILLWFIGRIVFLYARIRVTQRWRKQNEIVRNKSEILYRLSKMIPCAFDEFAFLSVHRLTLSHIRLFPFVFNRRYIVYIRINVDHQIGWRNEQTHWFRTDSPSIFLR